MVVVIIVVIFTVIIVIIVVIINAIIIVLPKWLDLKFSIMNKITLSSYGSYLLCSPSWFANLTIWSWSNCASKQFIMSAFLQLLHLSISQLSISAFLNSASQHFFNFSISAFSIERSVPSSQREGIAFWHRCPAWGLLHTLRMKPLSGPSGIWNRVQQNI